MLEQGLAVYEVSQDGKRPIRLLENQASFEPVEGSLKRVE
jgi:hypothetical protein